MRCDTCQAQVSEVSRVVIYVGYNKLFSKAVYNCPDCFAEKEKTKATVKSSKENQKGL